MSAARAALLIGLSLLAGCEAGYSVTRRVEVDEAIDLCRVGAVLVEIPGYSAADSRADERYWTVLGDDCGGPVSVIVDGRRLAIGSVWVGAEPTSSELLRATVTQRELIGRLRRAIPGLPASDAWAIERIGFDR